MSTSSCSPLAENFAFLAQRLAEQADVLVDHLVVRAHFHRHGVALQADPVDSGVLRIIQLLVPVGVLKMQLRPADENREIQHAVQRQFLRLPRPFPARMPPDLGGNIELAAVVPLRQPQ